ncbi:RDD family protein [Roseivivax sp. THAF40]|uniref:RDD family protein n=1 Tax=unclassified Roseivivax TaxID=2639302 RepID=UPI001267DFE9|nr:MULTISPECIES: RDD family protein [unclassified Roseivivax]QFS82658.1 RDD family protein [Roseivivax sp. THAF197b]QFT46427.1 RDD family protein [Roseivivax sp. THAF40]
MTAFDTHLPDPVRQPEFYDSVTLKRFLAWVIDSIFVAILVVPAIIFTFGIALFFFPLVWIAVSFTYRWVTIANGSATWGMRVMAIELRDAYANRLDASTAFMHTLGYALSVSTFIVQLGSVLLMLNTERKQGLSDLVLGTVMINRRV